LLREEYLPILIMLPFRVALCQFKVGLDKTRNLATASEYVARAVQEQANVVVLPECFNSPYGTQFFAEYAEDLATSKTAALLRQLAIDHGILLIGGSIPERDGAALYNTSLVFGPTGELLGKHRKVHLFDIDIPGKIRFVESEVLSPGTSKTVFQTPYCKFGLGICYDLRFPDYAKSICRDESVGVLAYPGCFNTVTGPKHWELLLRGRAVDNQVFVMACSQALDPEASYKAYGHSMVVSPWGEVLASSGSEEALVLADIDTAQFTEVRQAIPVRSQQRPEVYL
jgi:omega-amidase